MTAAAGNTRNPAIPAAVETAAEQVKRAHEAYAPHPALLSPQGWISFAGLGIMAERAAGLMAEGGASFGDRVVLYLENSAILRVLEHSILAAGLVRVALTPRLHPKEVAAITLDSGARLVCCSPESAQAVRAALMELGSSARVLEFSDSGTGNTPASIAKRPPAALDWPAPKPSDPAMLMYSSGTTGKPKAAIVTQASWVAHSRRALAELPVIGPGDVVLAVAPMTHFGGSIGLDCAMNGAATVPMSAFRPSEVLPALHRFAVTVLPLAPVMLAGLVDALRSGGQQPPPLKAVPYGGSPVSAETLAAAALYFPGALVQFYGLAEALAPLSCLSAADHDSAARALAHEPAGEKSRIQEQARHRLESAGHWVDGVEVRLENGQILVRADTVMPGYWNRPELSARVLDAEGWFATGDIAYVDDDGYVHLVDRMNDVIISGGFNIYPGEVERVIARVPGIREAVVLGVPDERWGERVHAVVVLEESMTEKFGGTAGKAELLELIVSACRGELASYKKPLGVDTVDEIPRNAAGKVDRNLLRQRLQSSGANHPGEDSHRSSPSVSR
jgi:acyl-CoA synthetase (AMP-forming)/AMP-acid ligase II